MMKGKKLGLFAVVFQILLVSANSFAAQNIILQEVQKAGDSDAINLTLNFDKSLDSKNARIESKEGYLQYVLSGVGVKSSRIIPIRNSLIEKVFIYQYSPGVARVRFIAKDSKINLQSSQFEIRNLKASQIQITMNSSVSEESRMIQDVVSNTAPIADSIEFPQKIDQAKPVVVQQPVSETQVQNSQSIGIKSDPSKYFLRMALALLFVVGLFVSLAAIFKKYSSKLNLKNLPFGKQERLIQIIATHRLGRNQSISLVKVTDEYLVLGTSGDNVSLITKLSSEKDVEKYLDNRSFGGSFEKHLKEFEKPEAYDGVRDVTEKAIAPNVTKTIKEKMTKLKHLN